MFGSCVCSKQTQTLSYCLLFVGVARKRRNGSFLQRGSWQQATKAHHPQTRISRPWRERKGTTRAEQLLAFVSASREPSQFKWVHTVHTVQCGALLWVFLSTGNENALGKLNIFTLHIIFRVHNMMCEHDLVSTTHRYGMAHTHLSSTPTTALRCARGGG